MAHGKDSNEKIIYVGDSRVKRHTKVYLPKDYSAYPGKSEAFIPNFLLKEWMVGVVVLVGFLVLVMSEPAPLGYPANPTNTAFIPMPDWYFLFLYQLLKYSYTSDKFVLIGTLVLPGVAFGSLMLAPFLDRGKERRFYRRPITSTLMFLSLICAGYLTVVSWDHYKHEMALSNTIPEHIKRDAELRAGIPQPKPGKQAAAVIPIIAPDDAGADIYKKSTCLSCHGAELKGIANAGIPGLRGVGNTYDKDQIMGIIKNGKGSMSKQYEDNLAKGLTDADINTLANWLAMQKTE